MRPGRPLLFLDCQCNEDVPVPYWSRNVKIDDSYLDLYNCVVPFHGKNIQLWLLNNGSYDDSGRDMARRLRIYLLRLNAENEGLRLVLRSIMSKTIDVQPRSPMSDNLQFYINEATRRIGLLDSQSSKKFEDDSNSHFVPKRALLNGIEGFIGSIGGCVTHSYSTFSARRSPATCFLGPLGSFRAH